MNINRCIKSVSELQTERLRTDSKAAANMGFAIAGVSFFADTFVQGGSSVLRTKFSAKTPRHRKPPNRYVPFEQAVSSAINTTG